MIYICTIFQLYIQHFLKFKFILTIIQTDRVHLRNKSTMLLQEGNVSMYPGLIGFMDTTDFNPTLASNLFDIMNTGGELKTLKKLCDYCTNL